MPIAQQIIKKCIYGELKDKLNILMTHHSKLISEICSACWVCLKNGLIIFVGMQAIIETRMFLLTLKNSLSMNNSLISELNGAFTDKEDCCKGFVQKEGIQTIVNIIIFCLIGS